MLALPIVRVRKANRNNQEKMHEFLSYCDLKYPKQQKERMRSVNVQERMRSSYVQERARSFSSNCRKESEIYT